MIGKFVYRSYTVERDGRVFIATSDDDLGTEIAAKELNELLRYIDQVWQSLDCPKDRRPRWVDDFLSHKNQRLYPNKYGKVSMPLAAAASLGFLILTAGSFGLHYHVLDADRDGTLGIDDAHMILDRTFGHGPTTYVVVNVDGSPEKITVESSHKKGVNYKVLSREKIALSAP